MSKIDESSCTAAEISKSVNVLRAIRWVAEARNLVKPETIVTCFKNCGIACGASAVYSRIGVDEDPFNDVEELAALLSQVGGSTCSPHEYVSGDDNIPVCDDAMLGDDWDDQFLAGISQSQLTEEIEDQEDESIDLEPPPPKLKSYREAISAIEDAQAFLDLKGQNEISTKLELEISNIICLQCASCTKQTTIDDFF